LADGQFALLTPSLIVATETGMVVLGMTAKFIFGPPDVLSFKRKAKASEKLH
jgi:hypothetical protein